MSFLELNLEKIYGCNFKDNFDVHMRNIRERTTHRNKHHCGQCKAPPTKSCYSLNKLHYAFCLAPVEADGIMVICGERFEVKSPGGCGRHPYHSCPKNLVFKEYLRGKELSPEAKDVVQKAGSTDSLADALQNVKIEDEDYTYYEGLKQATKYEEKDMKIAKRRTRTEARKLPPAMSYKAMLKSRARLN